MLIDLGMKVNWLARTGWMQAGIPPSMAETVSQHTFLALLTAVDLMKELKKRGRSFNESKVLTMVLMHDLAEGVVGDIPLWTSKRVKKRDLEEEALLSSGVPVEMVNTWREYEEGITVEAKISKLADLMSTWRMAIHYKEIGFPVDDIMRSAEKASLELAKELGLGVKNEDHYR